MQNLLDQHGCGLSVDGSFGANTLQAVHRFQSQYGLAVNGQVGTHTKAALYASASGIPDPENLLSSSCPANITEGAFGGCIVSRTRTS